jgi:hypothetical protein
MAKPCILCGSTDKKLTVEHVYGDWTAEVLPEQLKLRTRTVLPPDAAPRRSDEQDYFHQTRVRVLCDPCNQWGSRFESAMKALARDLFYARDRVLQPTELQVMAWWSTKVAIALEFLDRPEDRVLGLEYRHSFRSTGLPPGRTHIWAGATADLDLIAWRRWFKIAPSGLSAGGAMPSVISSFVLGQLAMFVLAVRTYTGPFHAPTRFAGALRQIWPPPPEVDWPPRRRLFADGYLSLATDVTSYMSQGE